MSYFYKVTPVYVEFLALLFLEKTRGIAIAFALAAFLHVVVVVFVQNL